MESEKQQDTIKKSIPWWLYLLSAILCYTLFKFALPILASDPAIGERFAEMGKLAAPITAIFFLLLAANALYKDVPEDKPEDPEGTQEDETPKSP
jgi:succinate dehydrogenase hydrophobic anchor subunit